MLMLLASAIAGTLFGGFLGLAIDGHGPPPYPWDATRTFGIGGMIVGAAGWIIYSLLSVTDFQGQQLE